MKGMMARLGLRVLDGRLAIALEVAADNPWLGAGDMEVDEEQLNSIEVVEGVGGSAAVGPCLVGARKALPPALSWGGEGGGAGHPDQAGAEGYLPTVGPDSEGMRRGMPCKGVRRDSQASDDSFCEVGGGDTELREWRRYRSVSLASPGNDTLLGNGAVDCEDGALQFGSDSVIGATAA